MATGGEETSVQNALEEFLQHHQLQESVSDIDEIVLSYVVSILEDLGDGANAEENIDVDQFIEMMDAYIPGFANIDSVEVCTWMFELAAKLSGRDTSISKAHEPDTACVKTELVSAAFSQPPDSKGAVQSRVRNQNSTGTSERSSSESSTGDGESAETSSTYIDEQIEQLAEMFPDTLRIELSHCLQSSEGDIGAAVQQVLHRQEAGLTITQEKKSKEKKPKHVAALDDKKTKENLLQRYGYVDINDDKKEYKPSVPKAEPKKMVRYLDNQIVNTKGQKFTEIKKDDNEEMKKTFINLKPARKYRFH